MKGKGPPFPIAHPMIVVEEMDCTRESYLDEKLFGLVLGKEIQLCNRRRTEPGFATIMDMQFEKKGEV